MQIEEALAQFLLQLEANGRSEHTLGQYRRHIRSFAAWLAPDDDLRWIDHQVLARFLASPAANARADGTRARRASTVNALRGSLKNFFGYLAASGILERDPSQLIRRARCGPPLARTLSEDDQRRLLFVLSQADDVEARRDHALFATMLRTGIRVGSAVALDVEDVDLARGELRLRRTKNDRPATAIIPREIRELLRAYLRGRASGPLFPGRRGDRISTRHAGRRLAAWLREAKIEQPASPHSLRHSFATALLARTGDLALVQIAMHHASIGSTTRYAQVAPERLRAALGA